MRKNPPRAAPRDDNKSAADIEFAWKVHAATQDWIRSVDTKSSITLAIIAGFGVFAANQVFSDDGSLVATTGRQLWAVRVMGVAFLLSGLFVLHAVFPSLKRKRARQLGQTGLIYFGHLRHRNAAEIEEALVNLDDSEIRKQLASQLDATSDIAWKKHARLQRAQIALVVAVIAFTLAETILA